MVTRTAEKICTQQISAKPLPHEVTYLVSRLIVCFLLSLLWLVGYFVIRFIIFNLPETLLE
jgi:hypothetical protein